MPQVAATLCSLRRWLPGSQVILVSWRGAEEFGPALDADKLLFLEDPGPATLPWEPKSNVLRQIRAVRAGLEHAAAPLCIKMRNDTTLSSAAILQFYAESVQSLPPATMFEQRILGASLYFRDPLKFDARGLFHPSDTFQLGPVTFRKDVACAFDHAGA